VFRCQYLPLKAQYGIFEAGISTVNEMEKLEKVIRPTIGILTNIGSSHDEGF
jgi:alanine racemase